MHRLLQLVLWLLPFCVNSQIDEVRRITKTLCSEEFHGRGYVNSGDSIAAAFIAAEFSTMGIEPVGESYFQNFKFAVNSFPGRMQLANEERTLLPGIHFVVDPASSGYKGKIHADLLSVEDILNEEKLKIRLQSILESSTYNAILLDLTDVGKDTLKDLAGIEQALATLMPVVKITDNKFTWSVARNQLANPLIHIQDSVYTGSGSFKLDIEAKFLTDHEARNVIAYIPAKRRCRKTIVFTAHYDHLGRMGEKTYFPGANDNASGTAMLLTMARYFKNNPAPYNIMFVAFAGEEAGLIGSKYYTDHPLKKLKKIRFLINLDIMGSGEEGITVVNATLFPEEFKMLQEINEENAFLTEVKSRGPSSNSDHYWFTEKGVPAFFIYTMGPNKNYHDVFDHYEELSFVEYMDITALLTRFVELLR